MVAFNIDNALKKIINSSSSNSFKDKGKGVNYFSSGGLKQPFPNISLQQQKFPEIRYNNAKKVVVDGKPVYYVGGKQNAPTLRTVQKVYRMIPDDKNVPVIFETKKQYLQQYIKNQEVTNNTKFTPSEKKKYIKHELKEMKPVVSRFTTYHNDYMPPETVFFTDNKFNKNNKHFEMSALHEYWHEKTEGNKQQQDDEVAAEQYARDRASKDWQSKNSQIYLDSYYKEDKKPYTMFVKSNYPKRIFVGSALRDVNINDKNINAVAQIVAHEELHNILQKEMEEDTSRALDKIAEPTVFINSNKDIINNPGALVFPSQQEIKINELMKEKKRLQDEEYNKVLQQVTQDNDIGKNRLNYLQMQRLKEGGKIEYTTVPSITPKPYEYLPGGQDTLGLKTIDMPPVNAYEKNLRNRTLNIIRKYPNIITESEKIPGQVVFYQGTENPEARGVFWEAKGEEPSSAFIDVRRNKNILPSAKNVQIARTAFHEIQHARQQLENPEEYKRSLEEEEYKKIPWSNRPKEEEAEKFAFEKVSEVVKGLPVNKGYFAYASPEEYFNIYYNPNFTQEDYNKFMEELKKRKEMELEQVEIKKTAGIQMLNQGDISRDRKGWPQATQQEQLKGVESGEKPIALVAVESFNNNYIDTSLPYLELPFDEKYKHMGHQRIYYQTTQEGLNNAHKALNIMQKKKISNNDHIELGKLFGYEEDEINNFLYAINNNLPLYKHNKVISYDNQKKDRTYTTEDFLPTVEKGMKVESTGTRIFNYPQENKIDIVSKPMYLSGKFSDLFKHGEHIQIVNPRRQTVFRDIKKVGDVAIATVPNSNEPGLEIPLTTDILYEPWFEDRGSLVFHAPLNSPPELQNELLKVATEEDEVRVIEDNQTKNRIEDWNKHIEEMKEKRRLEDEEYNKILQQVPNADINDKTYEVLKHAAERYREQGTNKDTRINEVAKLIEEKPFVYQVVAINEEGKPVVANILKGQERQAAEQIDFTMQNILVEQEAKQQLARILYNENYYHNLKPQQKRKILYLIRRQSQG